MVRASEPFCAIFKLNPHESEDAKMDLYVTGIGDDSNRCYVVCDDRLRVWDGKSFGKLESAMLFDSRSAAYHELDRIAAEYPDHSAGE